MDLIFNFPSQNWVCTAESSQQSKVMKAGPRSQFSEPYGTERRREVSSWKVGKIPDKRSLRNHSRILFLCPYS